MKNLIFCADLVLTSLKDDNYRNILFKRLNEFTPEQILKFGNYNPDLTSFIDVMIAESIRWTEKSKDKEKTNEIFRKKYVPYYSG
jgi:hypothetical protein